MLWRVLDGDQRATADRAATILGFDQPPGTGGAMQRDGYRDAIEAAGFKIETWRQNTQYRFVSERADSATQKYGVTSISLLARKVG